MRIYGGMPTGLGNEAGLVAGSPSFQIGPRSPFKGMPQEELNKLKEWDQDPKGLQQYYDRMNAPGPKLPFAGLGTTSNLVAQAYPGAQAVGNQAGMLGGGMEMGGGFGARPFNIDIDAEDQRLKSIGGSANIPLGKEQTLSIGGSFSPAYTDQMGVTVPQQYGVRGQLQTPGLGINVNYRNTGARRGMSTGGFPGEIQAGFQGRF